MAEYSFIKLSSMETSWHVWVPVFWPHATSFEI